MRADKAFQFMKVAESFSDMSKDTTKVGCVILDPETNSILSSGFNGMPRGIDETIQERWARPHKYSFISHSESNAVAQAALNGVSLRGGTCIVTMMPCSDCTKLLIQAGVRRIITKVPDEDLKKRWGESFKYSKIMMEESKITIQYV